MVMVEPDRANVAPVPSLIVNGEQKFPAELPSECCHFTQ
jgi:hypothetical protein